MTGGTSGRVPRTAPAPCFTRLRPEELPDLLALHDALHAAAPAPGLFVRETDAFFAAHIDAVGRVLGLRDGAGRLRAYGVLGLPGAEAEDNFGRRLGYAGADLARVCHLDGCGVDPAWRGRGLQRALTAARIGLGQTLGRDLAVSAAAPANVASIANLTGAGLEVVALVEKYDALRFLLVHDAHRARNTAADANAVRASVPLPGAPETHRARLANGTRGIGVRGGTQPALLYADDAPARSVDANPAPCSGSGGAGSGHSGSAGSASGGSASGGAR